MNALVGFFKIVLIFGAIFAAIVGVMYWAFWERGFVPHNGMAPTLFEGDEILVWRGSDNIRRGDIVVCEHPNKPGETVLSRVIGVEGDNLAEDRNTIRLNGKSITSRSDIMGKVMFASEVGEEPRELVLAKRDFFGKNHLFFRNDDRTPAIQQDDIEPGYIYVLSDNMPKYTYDSREFGLIDVTTCLGEAFMRLRRGNTPPDAVPYGDLDLLE